MNLTLRFTPRHDIMCPACARRVPEFALAFHENIGFCQPCLAPECPLPIPDAVEAVKYLLNRADVYSHHGLTVWAPRRKPPFPAAMLVFLGTTEFLATSNQTQPEHPIPQPTRQTP